MTRKVLALMVSFFLTYLASASWAEIGLWVSPKGAYFYPSNESTRKLFSNFIGGGLECGGVFYKRFALSGDLVYVRGRSREELQRTDNSGNVIGTFREQLKVLGVTGGFYYRFLNASTPYVGGGWGYYRSTWQVWDHSVASSAWAPYLVVGFDYRPLRWLGLGLEGRYQAAKGKRSGLDDELQDMHGVNLAVQVALWPRGLLRR